MAGLLDAIKGFEGYSPRASWDYKQNSVGYGTRARYPGEVIDRDEADRRLTDEVGKAQGIVDQFAPNIDAGTRAALTSLTYNAGDAWTRSGLGQAIQAGDLDRARASFLQYANAGGQRLPGLAARRAQEVAWIGNPNAFDTSQDAEAQSGGFYGQPTQPPARMALGGPPAGGQRPMPDLMTADPDGWSFLKYLNNAVQSPLFQSGAAMVAAGSQGLNPGSGFLAGSEAAGKASKSQLDIAKQRRELDAMQQRDQMWSDISRGQTPPWAQSLPPGTLDLARVLGPDQGTGLIAGMLTKGAERAIDRDKLKETARYHDILAQQAEAQLNESRNMNAERMLTMDAVRRQKEQELRAAEEEAAQVRRFLGPAPTAPSAAPAPPARVIPQSNAIEPSDPNLIRTQVAQQPSVDPAQAPAVPDGMVNVPGRGPMPAAQARELGMGMQTVQKLRPMGKQLVEDADKILNQGALGQAPKNKLEESLTGDVGHLARLNDIENSFKAEYQKLGPRIVSSLQGVAEFAGVPLKPEDQQKLADFTAHRRRVAANFNLLLKEASGTAVTESELKRMTLQEPTAEWNGLSPPDSPTQFMAKLQSAKADLIKAIARKNYMRTSMKLTDADIAELAKSNAMPVHLDNMKKIMDDQQRVIERKIRIENPGVPPEQLMPMVRQEFSKVFGI